MKLNWSQDIYMHAWHFAADAHRGQTVPGTARPYIVHIGNVAMEIMAALSATHVEQPDLAIQCALLHDVIEDTVVAYQQVAEALGVPVADGVLALSKDQTLPDKRTQMVDSLARIQQQPAAVWMVKLADRIVNLQPPPRHWDVDKMRNYRGEAIMIHDTLHAASSFLAARLLMKIDEYQAYIQ